MLEQTHPLCLRHHLTDRMSDRRRPCRYTIGAKSASAISARASQEITATSITQAGGETIMEFTRPLQPMDGARKTIPTSGSVKLVWAHGSDNTFGYHDSRGTAEVDFGSGCTLVWAVPRVE